MDKPLLSLLRRLELIEQLWVALDDRVSVLEEVTCTNANRLDDLEECQERLEDLIDDEY